MPFPDDFVELDAAKQKKAIDPNSITFTTALFRGRMRLRVSFDKTLIAVGQRMRAAYSARRKAFALDLVGAGQFKASASAPKSTRSYITIPVPESLTGLRKGMAGATTEWSEDGSMLVVPLPAELMVPRQEAPARKVDTLPALPLRGRTAIEAAKQAVPAPKFGAR